MRRSDAERAQFRAVQANRMRRDPTPAERKAWELFEPLGFKRQVCLSLENYRGKGSKDFILDLFHGAARLNVEVDGGYHEKRKGPDARRDRLLAYHGIRTIRIKNAELLEGEPGKLVELVAAEVQTHAKNRAHYRADETAD